MTGNASPGSSSPGSAPPSLPITCPQDGCEHLVEETIFAAYRNGQWPALCGAMITSTSLAAKPGRPCPACYERLEPPPQPVTSTGLLTLLWRALRAVTFRRPVPAVASDG